MPAVTQAGNLVQHVWSFLRLKACACLSKQNWQNLMLFSASTAYQLYNDIQCSQVLFLLFSISDFKPHLTAGFTALKEPQTVKRDCSQDYPRKGTQSKHDEFFELHMLRATFCRADGSHFSDETRFESFISLLCRISFCFTICSSYI